MNREPITEVDGNGEGMLSPSRPSHMQKKNNKPYMRMVGLGIMLLGTVTTILALLLLILPLFRVGSIEVVGNVHYSAEEIIEMSGIKEGSESMAVDVGKTADSLLDRAAYIQSCRISVYPFSVKIEVTEKQNVMYCEKDGKFVSFEYLSDDTILVLEVSEDPYQMEDFPEASIPKFSTPKVGQRLSFTKQALNITYMKTVLDALKEYSLYQSTESIDFSSRTNVFFTLDNGCRVCLGTVEEIDDKLVEAINLMENNKNATEVDVSDLSKPTVKTY